jgi:ribosomal RNA-processing protein 17
VDHEEEYIDEDRYTTVTVESVAVSRDGFEKPPKVGDAEHEEGTDKNKPQEGEDEAESTSKHPKKRKKKFRYETKIERQLTERKHKLKSRAKRS